VIDSLPAVDACLNGASALLLCGGFLAIRRGRKSLHKALMLGAVAASALFLIGYLTYHSLRGTTHFPGTGAVRTVYLLMLFTHSLLALVNVHLVILTLLHAFKGRFERHRRIAPWTFGVWLYVSVTGILVYLMLYRWF